jgi:hypothetical protein
LLVLGDTIQRLGYALGHYDRLVERYEAHSDRWRFEIMLRFGRRIVWNKRPTVTP